MVYIYIALITYNMNYLTFDCSLDFDIIPEQICCDECSGRLHCVDMQKEGLGDTSPNDHCVRCGDYWFDKGAICEECERNFCPSYWQNFFVFRGIDCQDEICGYGADGVCPECFVNHPEWWCSCNENCDTSKKKWDKRMTMDQKFKGDNNVVVTFIESLKETPIEMKDEEGRELKIETDPPRCTYIDDSGEQTIIECKEQL